ncbi:hypothetical protein A2335_03650 [Candidatus Peregrinibacteria bacterium RIFOXYB2_FULL_32_7]|nr:MAG: hypothetical protein A2335_03650 [Candidatus Peregrinibacteria bacterium RIFOXYB2_FULL_32_7]
MSKDVLKDFNSDRFRVVIFGSARVQPDNQIYQDIRKLAKKIGQAGHDIVTGGGPGIMEAANLGHREGTPQANNPARSIGLNIRLPMEQQENHNLDIMQIHDRFSTRLDEFMALSNIVIIAPAGGIGTLLEFFYTWQLLQVHHIRKMPIVLIGDMWKGLIEWIRKEPLIYRYLDPEDMNFIIHVDNCEEAFAIIEKTHQKFMENKKISCQIVKKL